jgi:hypothetical protein
MYKSLYLNSIHECEITPKNNIIKAGAKKKPFAGKYSMVALLSIRIKVDLLFRTLQTDQKAIDINIRFRIFADLINFTIRSNPKLKSVSQI